MSALTSLPFSPNPGSLVRSLAGLLSLANSAATPGTAHDETADRKLLPVLDGLALFFVERHGEHVALSAHITRDQLSVLVSGPDREGLSGGDDSEPDEGVKSALSDIGDARIYVDLDSAPKYLRPFLRLRGTSPWWEHLERLRLQIDTQDNDQRWSDDEFLYYIGFFSLSKIQYRLAGSCIPGTSTRLFSVFVNISDSNISKGCTKDLVLPEKTLQFSEEALSVLINLHQGGETSVERVSAEIVRLGADTETELRLWRYFVTLLQNLRTRGTRLLHYRDQLNLDADWISDTVQCLKAYCLDLELLEELVSRSPAFWRLCHNRAMVAAIEEAREIYEARIREKRNAPNPDSYNVEDEPEELDASDSPLMRKWLKLVTQWIRVYRELKTRTVRLLRDRQLTLVEIENKRADAAKMYPPLVFDQMIAAVVGHHDLRFEIRNDKQLIEQAIVKGVKRNTRVQLVSDLNKLFDRDNVHAESLLACDPRTEVQSIGVSKQCCFLCNALLDHKDVRHSGSHGKVYSWIPPSRIRDSDLQVLADRIKDIVVDFINLHYYPRNAPDSLASDSSGDEKASHVERSVTLKILDIAMASGIQGARNVQEARDVQGPRASGNGVAHPAP